MLWADSPDVRVVNVRIGPLAFVDGRQYAGSAADQFAAEEDICADRQFVGQGKILIDDLDPSAARLFLPRPVDTE
jgi:hypothetical protein